MTAPVSAPEPIVVAQLETAARLIEARGWQAWDYEDAGQLSVEGALIVAAGGAVHGITCEAMQDVVDQVLAAASWFLSANELLLEADQLYSWEQESDATTRVVLASLWRAAAAGAVAAGHTVRIWTPDEYADRWAVRYLAGRAIAYDHRRDAITVDCGPYGQITTRPQDLDYALEPAVDRIGVAG